MRLWPDWRRALSLVQPATVVTFRMLYVLLIMSHDRRRILHFNVTTSPSARWTAQQVREAFPYDTAPRYLLRDRDCPNLLSSEFGCVIMGKVVAHPQVGGLHHRYSRQFAA
jgi:hypothetical protein